MAHDIRRTTLQLLAVLVLVKIFVELRYLYVGRGRMSSWIVTGVLRGENVSDRITREFQIPEDRDTLTTGKDDKADKSVHRCPLRYRPTECRYEIKLAPFSRQRHRGVIIHRGSLTLQGLKVYSWRTVAGLILVDVDTKCNLISTKLFDSPNDRFNVSAVKSEVTDYISRVCSGHLIMGVMYDKSNAFCRYLLSLGGDEKYLTKEPWYMNSALLFQFRKGYPAHSTLVMRINDDKAQSLKRKYHFGHDFNVSLSAIGYGMLWHKHPEIQDGGVWIPPDCRPRWRIAFIIPFRGREKHLWVFLENMFRFLESLLIQFRVFVIEQGGDVLFNRAKLLNIGFNESKAFGPFDCYVFHDVDQIPEDLSNMYGCLHSPRHLVVSRSSTQYRVPYKYFFGGAMLLIKEHIEMINGFPNRYFGWGGEDDEIKARLLNRSLTIVSYPEEIGRYTSLHHNVDEYNPHVKRRVVDILNQVEYNMKIDGLNTLQYAVMSREERPLYTHIIVQFPGPRTYDEIESSEASTNASTLRYKK